MTHDTRTATSKISQKVTMLGAALSLLIPAASGGCGGSNNNTNTTPPVQVTVGAMLPRTGPNANSDWVSAVELAVLDMTNAMKMAKSIAQPITFSVQERDTASDETKAHDAMAEYATLNAKIVITEASNAAIGGNKYNYEQIDAAGAAGLQMPLVSFTATSASINNINTKDAVPARQEALQDTANWFYRTCPVSNNLSAIRLNEIFGGLVPGTNGDINGDGLVKVVWIGTNDTSTVASITGDQKAVTTYLATLATPPAYSAETVAFDPGTDPTAFNYSDAIAKATDGHNETTMMDDGLPDLIINKALPNVAIPFIKAYKQNANNTTNIFQDGSFRRNTLLSGLGAAADGQVGVSNIAYTHNPSGTLFATEQQAATTFPPAAYESQGYDAMALALLAIIKASIAHDNDPAATTPEEVRVALGQLNDQDPNNATTRVTFGTGAAEFKRAIDALVAKLPVDYIGASGDVNFDAVGDTRDLAVLWKIMGGQFVETQTFDCVKDNSCLPVP